MFHCRLHSGRNQNFKASPLRYASKPKIQYHPTVKLPGSFRLAAGNRHLDRYCIIHRAAPGDSPPVVKPFMRAGTYPARGYATLELSGLELSFTGAYTSSFPNLRQSHPKRLTYQYWTGLSSYISPKGVCRNLCFC